MQKFYAVLHSDAQQCAGGCGEGGADGHLAGEQAACLGQKQPEHLQVKQELCSPEEDQPLQQLKCEEAELSQDPHCLRQPHQLHRQMLESRKEGVRDSLVLNLNLRKSQEHLGQSTTLWPS